MATPWQVGDVINDRWEIHRVLGGGMGVVYVVYDRHDRVPYAAKTFKDEVFERNPEIARRFEQEVLTWIQLDVHPNITQAIFVVPIGGKPFLFLEYISGGDLSSWIGTPRLQGNLSQVLDFAIQFCDGMIYAFDKGLKVHRDIKPQNCLITEDGRLTITDFGLAKVFDDVTDAAAGKRHGRWLDSLFGKKAPPKGEAETVDVHALSLGMTRTGAAAGTCTHMAPEQFENARHVDVRADIYSFGVVLFQMAIGELPFVGLTWQEFAHLHKNEAPPALTLGSPELVQIIHTCLAKDPRKRFASFAALRKSLAAVYEKLTGSAAPEVSSGAALQAVHWMNKGTALVDLGLTDEGLACLNRAVELGPEHKEVWVGKGAALFQLSRFEESFACNERALELDPGSVEARRNKGLLLAQMGRDDQALDCLDQILETHTDDYMTWVAKARVLAPLGRAREALECCDKSIESYPRYFVAWTMRGAVLRDLGRDEEALDCYDEALKLNPHDHDAWANRMSLCHRLGLEDEVLESFDHMIQLKPTDTLHWSAKAEYLFGLGRFPEALISYDRALTLDPSDFESCAMKGNCLIEMGRLDEALACYDRALAIQPVEEPLWCNKGFILVRMQRFGEAVNCLKRAVALDPKDSKAWSLMGEALINGFRLFREALACLEQAQRLGDAGVDDGIELCRSMIES